MSQSTTNEATLPVIPSRKRGRPRKDGRVDAEVVQFREAFEEQTGVATSRSALDELVREGARQMLQAALESEVDTFLADHAQRIDAQGRQLVVRNGHLPERKILTGAGSLAIEQPRARDNSDDAAQRVAFSSALLPPYLRK